MKPSWLNRAGTGWLLLGLLGPALLAASKPKPGKPAPPPAIAKLTWLAGSWRMEKLGRVVDEHWMAPAAGVMLGMARTMAKGKVVGHEFLQIREGPGGDLFYITQTSGQKEAAYQIKSLTDTAVVFENQQDDFPQKISYTLQADGSLRALFEGVGADGATKRIETAFLKKPSDTVP